MTQKQLIEWAIKGIAAEIDELEKTVRKGCSLIEQIDNGEKVKTQISRFEILEIIQEKKKEIERLDKERFNLQWELSEFE